MAVVEQGGVSRAAEQLHTVQSNVTSRIKRLEQELGQPLFLRVGRGLSLSPAGRELMAYALEILSLERQAQNAMNEIGAHGGTLLLGCMETYAAMHLPFTLAAVQNDLPNIRFQVDTATSAELVERVRTYQLDCAIVGGEVNYPGIRSDLLLEEQLVLVRPKAKADDTGLPLILFREGCVYRARALAWQQQMGRADTPVMAFGTLEGILGCVAVGLGCTLMPRGVLEHSRYREQLDLSELPDEIARVATRLISHDQSALQKTIDAFKSAVLDGMPRVLDS